MNAMFALGNHASAEDIRALTRAHHAIRGLGD